MRRLLAILVGLCIWSVSSGLIEIAHEHQHAGVPHDESTCHICIAVHAAMDTPTVQNAPLIVQRAPGQAPIAIPVFVASDISLVESCRGPPAC